MKAWIVATKFQIVAKPPGRQTFDMQQLPPSESRFTIGPPPPPPLPSPDANSEAIRKHLASHGWPTGLQNVLVSGLKTTPARFIICDDSGSMGTSDGRMVVGEGAQTKLIKCSRWSELTETLKFHIETARIAEAPTEFRMLNGAAPIMIGSSAQGNVEGLPKLKAILEGAPGGGTPLCYHVNEVTKQIIAIAPDLRAAGRKAALIIYTDGEASDGDIAAALKPLHDLPVWVVIRLCTNESRIVQYWASVDNEIELNMDVLDDPIGEAQEIHKANKWFNYGVPLHRLREFGITAKEMDALDEAKLSAEQMRAFCGFLFGVRADLLFHPDTNWKEFYEQISVLNDKEPKVWCPVKKNIANWINLEQLKSVYYHSGRSDGKVDAGDRCCLIA